MQLIHRILRALVLVFVFLAYGTSIWMGTTEESRRSVRIVEDRPDNDFVGIEMRITSLDTARGILTETIRLVPAGRFAIDRNTPAVDLKLLVNSVSGQQSISFPKGVRIAPIDTTVMLSGNPNKYPFDEYSSDVDLLVTTPAHRVVTPLVTPDQLDASGALASGSLVVGTSDLNNNVTVPIAEGILASIPSYKFRAEVARDGSHKLSHTHFAIRRANNVILVSVIAMATMFVLAISIVSMVMRVNSSPGEINLLPLSLCVTLIFGLPALRNIQPGVPSVGVLGDYLSFIWAELMVSISGIALAWTWIIRSRKPYKDQAPR